jgi:hypothetical protein
MEMITARCPDYAEGTGLLGMLYESFGELDKAMNCYEKSLEVYQSRFVTKRDFSSRQNEILMYLMLGKEDSVNLRLRALPREFPSEMKGIGDLTDFVRTFDRSAYISKICGQQASPSRNPAGK